MILKTALLIKILLFFAAGFGIFWVLRNRCAKKYAILFACLVAIIGGFVGQKISSYIPPLNDIVTITALGEKNPAAANGHVGLVGYTVDEIDVLPNTPIEGKWFWNGPQYYWRTKGDVRQPQGTTNTILMEIPVGQNRTVNFSTSKWHGLVSVEFNGEETVLDLFSEETAVLSASITQSTASRLILNQLRYLSVFAAVLLLLSGVITIILRAWLADSEKCKKWLDSHFWVIYILVGAISFIFLVKHSGDSVLYHDELFTISTKDSSVWKSLFILHDSYYPPLLSRLNALWYHIAPYGEQWLFLPLEIATICGAVFTGLSGELLKNRRTGVLAVIFSAFSFSIVTTCAYYFRPYGYMYCCSAIMLYTFLRKNIRMAKGEKTIGLQIIYLISSFLLCATHIFGVFYTGLLFLIDCALFFRKKLSWKFILTYIADGVLYLPWIYNMLCYDVFSMHASFQHQPTFARVVSLLERLTGQNNISYHLFFLGVLCVLVFFIQNENWKKTNFKTYGLLLPVWLLAAMIGGIYFYGTFINTQATLWTERYFDILYPVTAILVSLGLDWFLSALNDKTAQSAIAILLSASFVITSIQAIINDTSKEYETSRSTADWLYTQSGNIYNNDTLVIFCGYSNDIDGWKEYYLEQQGKRDSLNVALLHHINPSFAEEYLLQYKTIYMYYEIYNNGLAHVNQILDEYYDLTHTQENVKVRVYTRKDT